MFIPTFWIEFNVFYDFVYFLLFFYTENLISNSFVNFTWRLLSGPDSKIVSKPAYGAQFGDHWNRGTLRNVTEARYFFQMMFGFRLFLDNVSKKTSVELSRQITTRDLIYTYMKTLLKKWVSLLFHKFDKMLSTKLSATIYSLGNLVPLKIANHAKID